VFSGGGNATLTLGGLTAGLTYEIELWADDSRGGSTRFEELSDANGDSPATVNYTVPSNGNPQGSGGEIGQYAIGTFVADGNPEVIDLDPGNAGVLGSNGAAQINSFQLRQVPAGTPEPTTLGLLGIASLGMLARRRRA
jgi:PEP-CTERM motif